MDDENAHSEIARTPSVDDFTTLCEHLNEQGVKYVVVGGMAMIQHGFVRATEDIDLLLESSQENQGKLRKAMAYLPDKAIEEVRPSDLDEYVVVRVVDEFVVDLMKKVGGFEYAEAVSQVEMVEVNGVQIPLASLSLMRELKKTVREKDAIDRVFLEDKLREEG